MSAILSTPEIRTTLSSPCTALTDRENAEGMFSAFPKILHIFIKSNIYTNQN